MVIALWHHVFVLTQFGGFGWDEMWQLTAARSFVAGHGLTIPNAHFPDVESTWYRAVTGWPPGYALIACALLHFTSDLWRIALGVDVAATVLFFLAFVVILRRLGELVPLEVCTGLVLWMGLVASPLKGLALTDRLALALYMAAIALATPIVEERGRHRMWLACSSGLLAGLSGWIRFAYWPLAPLIGLALCLTGYLRGGARTVWRYAATQATVVALVIGGVAAYQRHMTGGHATYISIYYTTASGLHWGNLAAFYPFASSLTGLSDILAGLDQTGRPPPLRWAASLIILAAVALGLGRSLRNPRTTRGVSYLIVVSLLSIVTCVAMLSYLSVRYPKNAAGWTYVEEIRYFAPTALGIYLGLLLLHRELPRRLSGLLTAGRGIGLAAGITIVALLLAGRREGPFGFLYQEQGARSLRWSYVAMTQAVKRVAAAGRGVVYVDPDDTMRGETRRGVAGMAGARAVPAGRTEDWLAQMPSLRSRMPRSVRLLVALPKELDERSPARHSVMTACLPVATLLDRTPLFECRGQARKVPDRWKVATVGDFNGDGKPDLLWRDTASGELVVWYLRGLARAGESAVAPSAAPGREWEIIGASDVDGDGKSELFCRSGASSLRLWHLDGPRTQRGIGIEGSAPAQTRWLTVAVGDFDRDGKADVVWQDSVTEDVAVRPRGRPEARTAFTTPPGPPDVFWQIVGVGDFDGDGNADLLWRKWSSGKVMIWFMNRFSRRVQTRLEPPASADQWQPVAAGDFDRDGKAEIVWNDLETGTVRIVPTGGGDAVQWRFPR